MTRARESHWPVVVALLAGSLFVWNLAHGQSTPLTPAQIAERTIPSVVLIRAAGGLGSGFIVAADGRIVTNLHVIGSAREATVVLADGRQIDHPEVMAVDEARDLIVLRIAASRLSPLPLGDSRHVRAGDHVVAIGHPLGLSNTVSDGLVSAIREVSPGLSVLQLSAPISPGSSGGPLLDDRGQVIGISTLVSTRGQNVNFGVPIDALKPLLAATKATPLARWRPQPQARLTRAIPHHELSLLADCTSGEIEQIEKEIAGAISIGAPIYNDGDREGCYRVYANAALALDRKLGGCAGARGALLDGVRRADKLNSVDEKAWAMRDAFDGMLEVIDRRHQARAVDAAPAGRVLPAPPPRNVPHHAMTVLDRCAPASVARIGKAIDDAISVGAPLYNQGHYEACFRIYEAVALELQRDVPACAAAKKALMSGVTEAAKRKSGVDKAWAMRDAFDGMLDLIERKLGASE